MAALQFSDRVEISGTRRREDGALLVDARVARTGIQLYTGKECKRPDLGVVRVYRPADEVFSKDSMATFAHRPVTMGHPGLVDASNWRDHAVGQTGEEIAKDGETVRVPLMISDAESIRRVESGERELSAGYVSMLDWTPGETPDGEKYDAVQRDIRINHVAVVERARGGSQLRIGDRWGVSPVTEARDEERPMSERTMMVDGLSVVVTDAAAVAIEKLLKERDAARSELADAKADAEKKIAEKDATIGTLDAKIEEIEASAPTADALDALAEERASVITDARSLHPKIEVKGRSLADIRLDATSHAVGADKMKGKPEAYVAARFDAAVEALGAKKSDPLAAGGTKVVLDSGDAIADRQAAFDALEKEQREAWNSAAKGGMN